MSPAPQQAGKPTPYTLSTRLRAARGKEFSIQGIFKYGYRNKEDISNLPAETLVVGSQNVLTNAAEQVTIRNGYQYDGAAGNQNTYGIDSAFDFNTQVNGIQNLRKWGTNLEMRYVNPVTNVVSWINIYPNLSATNVCNFIEFWEPSTSQNVCLFVNGNNNVYRWTGGVGSFASATSSTITLLGTKTLPNLNFDSAGTLIIDGVSYTYTSAGFNTSQIYSESPTNATVPLDLTHWISQMITTGSTATQITTVTFKLNVDTTTGTFIGIPTIQGYIYTDNSGVPGTIIGGVSSSASASANGDYTLTFTFNQAVNPATNYHIAFNTPYPTGSYPGPALAFTLNAYIGASSGVGTHTATSAVFGTPTSWSASNGYFNMTVNENDLSTMTFSGVTPDPTTVTINVGDAVIQLPAVATAAVNGCPLPTLDLITCLNNQVLYGCFTNSVVYLTKINTYNDTTFSNPRLIGDGGSATLEAPPVGFLVQEADMYISAGLRFWYNSSFTTNSTDQTKQTFAMNRIKTTSRQGAQSQGLMGNFKNSIVYVSNEPIFNSFGPVKNIYGDPQVVNMSDPIKYDMDAYNFTGGSVHYSNYFIYFSAPKMGIIRLYNVNKKYWEAPQTIPVGFFYEVNGNLYGHSATTNESYQLFVPEVYNDLGNPISAIAAFPYSSQEGGSAPEKKNFNKHYTEGYIAGNTKLTLEINYDFGGFSESYSIIISGANKAIIFNKITDGSLGRNPLGIQPIGTILNLPNQPPIPKFRVINTFPRVNCFEYQIVYSSYDVDQNWALLRLGPAVSPSTDIPTEVTE